MRFRAELLARSAQRLPLPQREDHPNPDPEGARQCAQSRDIRAMVTQLERLDHLHLEARSLRELAHVEAQSLP